MIDLELPTFGGLDLRRDPQDIGPGAAIDLLNVELDVAGSIRSRDGFTSFGTLSGRVIHLSSFAIDQPAAYTRLFAAIQDGSGNFKVGAANLAGSVSYTAALNGLPGDLVGFASGSNHYAYGAVGDASGHILRWDEGGPSWSYPNVGYSGTFCAITPRDARLAIATTNEGSFSRVRFSDPGAPETFTSDNWIDLAPDDGSAITGMAVFADELYVFKSRQFFVHHNTVDNGSGVPIFDFRPVSTGIGIPHEFAGSCVASPQGVFFLSTDGIYVTTGGPPRKVSAQLDPLFRNSLPATYTGTAINRQTTPWNNSVSRAKLCWFEDRLYFAAPTTSGATAANDRLFVYDPRIDGWLVWDVAASALAAWMNPSDSAIGADVLYFGYASGSNNLGWFTPGTTTDAGTAITAKYRPGWWTPTSGVVRASDGKRPMRAMALDGSGTVTLKIGVDDNATLPTGSTVALGSWPAVTRGFDWGGTFGRNFSPQVSGTAPWSVSKMTARLP